MGIINKIILLSALSLSVNIGFCQNIINGHEYVDLGLSVNWANCNVGSNSPEEIGDYFAWGETYSKSCYNKMTYRYSGGKEGIFESLMDYTKYLGKENQLNPNDVKLEDNDDVAYFLWGAKWRMPTMNEVEELVNNCKWEFGEFKSTKGCWAISKINGNKIFFPLAGYVYEDRVTDVGASGKYWASELRSDMCFEAYQLYISFSDNLAEMNKNKTSVFLSDDGMREYGRSVRPVCKK